MTLSYAVLGSGAMGLRFGLLLKEHLKAQVDLSILGKNKLIQFKNKVVSTSHVMARIVIWFQLIFIYQKTIVENQMS